MPITGVYFIPSAPNAQPALAAITERLRTAFADEDLIPLGYWKLDHKLMRDTPGLLPASANPSQKPSKPRYMQFLSLTHYPTHGFVYTSETAEKQFHPPNVASASPTPSAPGPGATSPSGATPGAAATPMQPGAGAATDLPMIMATVAPAAYSTLFQHFTYACQPFWCHRLTVSVPNGMAYDVGDFRVRVGDVRQTFPTVRVRGTVVEIEWRGPSVVDAVAASTRESRAGKTGSGEDADSGIDVSVLAVEEGDVEAEYAATAVLIRELWARIGVEGAREAILVPGVGKEIKEQMVRYRTGKEETHKQPEFVASWSAAPQEMDPNPLAGTDLARQYMEVLRFNR
ncbi:hypothetical protein N7462_002634 [Penicillium macrosclerotiorum]|uniref:uncharacterized protein n=1 Tax=Penicillium macrosclerotiorum TaxID=303699 RepID=UPI00254936E7|nr:uncharacterized protein N7462_002634 [Penicillium macrosclerotiorum]KAJ5693211.1 hypothetical protein N7462_002634 [Penicillium macrosclerotiorum]